MYSKGIVVGGGFEIDCVVGWPWQVGNNSSGITAEYRKYQQELMAEQGRSKLA